MTPSQFHFYLRRRGDGLAAAFGNLDYDVKEVTTAALVIEPGRQSSASRVALTTTLAGCHGNRGAAAGWEAARPWRGAVAGRGGAVWRRQRVGGCYAAWSGRWGGTGGGGGWRTWSCGGQPEEAGIRVGEVPLSGG